MEIFCAYNNSFFLNINKIFTPKGSHIKRKDIRIY